MNVPGGYVRENVALAYGVTVHKSQGLTTDEAVLVVDKVTTAEQLYVGLTRGRTCNLAVVVTEPLDDGHRRHPAPTAHDVFAGALGRSGAEQSATEVVRSVLAHSHDVGVLRAVLADALRRVDDLAGRDRSREIGLLQRKMEGAQTNGPAETERLRALLDAQGARSEWLDAHPELVCYVLDLAQRVRGQELRRALGNTGSPHVDHALSAGYGGPEL
ncbi:MAG: C-terminal helicase domain-containing protein [Acidimicrobiales bacterium]